MFEVLIESYHSKPSLIRVMVNLHCYHSISAETERDITDSENDNFNMIYGRSGPNSVLKWQEWTKMRIQTWNRTYLYSDLIYCKATLLKVNASVLFGVLASSFANSGSIINNRP